MAGSKWRAPPELD